MELNISIYLQLILDNIIKSVVKNKLNKIAKI